MWHESRFVSMALHGCVSCFTTEPVLVHQKLDRVFDDARLVGSNIESGGVVQWSASYPRTCTMASGRLLIPDSGLR